MKLFLGGTIDDKWRDTLIPLLNDQIKAFNPVVSNWTPANENIENAFKKIADVNLFMITKKHKGMYTVAEVVDLSNKSPKSTVLCILKQGMRPKSKKSLNAVANLVKENGIRVFYSITTLAKYLNRKAK